MASALAIRPATAGACTTSRCAPVRLDQNVRTCISNWSKRYVRMLSRSASKWSWNHDHTSRAAIPWGDVELVPTASSMFGKCGICRTLMACGGADIMGSETAPPDGDCEGTPSGASPGPAWRRMEAWLGKELEGGRWDACAWERRLVAVGVFSSAKTTCCFAPLARFSELRFDAFAELWPSDASSSSSSSDPLPASACSLASRAALTDCCAALLFDLRM